MQNHARSAQRSETKPYETEINTRPDNWANTADVARAHIALLRSEVSAPMAKHTYQASVATYAQDLRSHVTHVLPNVSRHDMVPTCGWACHAATTLLFNSKTTLAGTYSTAADEL